MAAVVGRITVSISRAYARLSDPVIILSVVPQYGVLLYLWSIMVVYHSTLSRKIIIWMSTGGGLIKLQSTLVTRFAYNKEHFGSLSVWSCGVEHSVHIICAQCSHESIRSPRKRFTIINKNGRLMWSISIPSGNVTNVRPTGKPQCKIINL